MLQNDNAKQTALQPQGLCFVNLIDLMKTMGTSAYKLS